MPLTPRADLPPKEKALWEFIKTVEEVQREVPFWRKGQSKSE